LEVRVGFRVLLRLRDALQHSEVTGPATAVMVDRSAKSQVDDSRGSGANRNSLFFKKIPSADGRTISAVCSRTVRERERTNLKPPGRRTTFALSNATSVSVSARTGFAETTDQLLSPSETRPVKLDQRDEGKPEEIGKFEDERDILSGLRDGTLLMDDYYWCEGMSEWKHLSTLEISKGALATTAQKDALKAAGLPFDELTTKAQVSAVVLGG
jgi:hypothetical protein